MVNKLRKKFVITAMLSLLVILITMIAVINVVNIYQIKKDADSLLLTLTTNDGFFPGMRDDIKRPPSDTAIDGTQEPKFDKNTQNPGFNPAFDPSSFDKLKDMHSMEMPYQSRYFWVKFDESGTVTETNTMHVAAITEETATEYANDIYASSKNKGYSHSYRYMKGELSDGGSIIVFLDISTSTINAHKLLGQSLLIGTFTLIAMFILVFLFSGQAVAPVVESLEKQKRFITDAGHELKTPLAVISANVDVLELESGKSEWTSSIKNQVNRMNSLVKNLLTLSRMDEERMRVVYSDFDMSSTIKDTADSFEAIAEAKNKIYKTFIEDGIHIIGDKNSISQLTSILLDNAMKYSSENGVINVILSKDKNIVLEISNTSDCIPTGNLDRLFDRFYRADSSRSRETGGYGIGLSVAKAIAISHGGTIEALRQGDKTIRFVVTIPKTLPKSLQNNVMKK